MLQDGEPCSTGRENTQAYPVQTLTALAGCLGELGQLAVRAGQATGDGEQREYPCGLRPGLTGEQGRAGLGLQRGSCAPESTHPRRTRRQRPCHMHPVNFQRGGTESHRPLGPPHPQPGRVSGELPTLPTSGRPSEADFIAEDSLASGGGRLPGDGTPETGPRSQC